MSNSAPPIAPPPPLPPEGDTEKSTDVDASQNQIDKAAEEGRLTIRPQDLSVKVIEALATKFGPEKVVGKLTECMEATKTMAIGGRPYETPDFKTQLDALKLLLQYQVGMPVARTEVVTHNVDTMQTLESKMQKSPALRRAVGRMLDRTHEDGAAPAIEVGSVPPETEREIQEAEEVLQSVPEQPETPIEAEVRTKPNSMKDFLKVRGPMSAEEKLTR